ncbi:MAG: hypothetical protein WC656_01455 [Sulfurimonas sp.]|jgi:hypothetical protein
MEQIIKKHIDEYHKKEKIAHAEKEWNRFLASSEINRIFAIQKANMATH